MQCTDLVHDSGDLAHHLKQLKERTKLLMLRMVMDSICAICQCVIPADAGCLGPR